MNRGERLHRQQSQRTPATSLMNEASKGLPDGMQVHRMLPQLTYLSSYINVSAELEALLRRTSKRTYDEVLSAIHARASLSSKPVSSRR